MQAKDQQYRREQEEAANRAAEASTSVEVAEADTAHDGLAPEARSAIEPNGPERTDLDRWRTRVANVARRLEQARRWFRLRVRTSAGIALLTLEAARDAMQPPLKLMDPDVGPAGMLSDMLKLVSSSDYSLLKVADDDRLTEADVGVIADRVADVRSSTERLHEELRRRIGTTRSRLALVHRSSCAASGTTDSEWLPSLMTRPWVAGPRTV